MDMNSLPHKGLFICQVLEKGLQYLHFRNIVHCHLQAKCIMLDNQLTPLVTDVENNEIATVKVGDRERWQALEVLNNDLSSKSTDIWSFGVLMWEVLSLGAAPYEDLSIATSEIKEFLESGRASSQQICSDAVFKVMEGCWNERSRMRPDVYVLNGSLDEMLTQDHDELISMGVTSNVSPGDVTIDVSTDRLYPNLDQEEDFTAF
ncbi:tyrosine-protein kinase receptor Tie-1-like [Ciona intestinalis]